MITDFNIVSIMLLRQLNLVALSVSQQFYIYCKGKTPLFFICCFSCCLVNQGWALKVAYQLAIRGLVAYKPVAYKKNQVYLIKMLQESSAEIMTGFKSIKNY